MANALGPLTHALTRPLALRLADLEILRQGAPTVPWTPLDLGATLKAWWSADDHGTARMVDDGAGLISSWTDKVGGIVITGTTTARPTWAATSFNSAYAGVTFDGVANCLIKTPVTVVPTSTTPGSIFAVASNTNAGAGSRVLFNYGGGAATTDRRLLKTFATVSRFTITQNGTNLADTVATFDGAHFGSGSWTGTAQAGRLDGQDTTPASGAATVATGTTRLTMGATNGASPTTFWQGPVSDVLVTLGLTTLEHQKLEGWAAWNKGLTGNLPAGHPYKSAAP